jgi:uncharacterized protein
MIVSFSVSNFRSFSEEQTLSLVAHKRHAASHEDHALAIPGSDERVLRAAVIYGANGAGKSNLVKALSYLEEIAIQGRDTEIAELAANASYLAATAPILPISTCNS